jgi:hypothetical protein
VNQKIPKIPSNSHPLPVMQHSGSHMEHTILASVTSILIGFVVMENQSNEQVVRRFLRDGKFTGMVETLRQYYDFMNLTVSVSGFGGVFLDLPTSFVRFRRFFLDFSTNFNSFLPHSLTHRPWRS